MENLYKLEKFFIEDTALKVNLIFFKLGLLVICQYTQSKLASTNLNLTKINTNLPREYRPVSSTISMFSALDSPSNTELQINVDGSIYIKRTAGTFSYGVVSYITN